jgi:hypothetical protein
MSAAVAAQPLDVAGGINDFAVVHAADTYFNLLKSRYVASCPSRVKRRLPSVLQLC